MRWISYHNCYGWGMTHVTHAFTMSYFSNCNMITLSSCHKPSRDIYTFHDTEVLFVCHKDISLYDICISRTPSFPCMSQLLTDDFYAWQHNTPPLPVGVCCTSANRWHSGPLFMLLNTWTQGLPCMTWENISSKTMHTMRHTLCVSTEFTAHTTDNKLILLAS